MIDEKDTVDASYRWKAKIESIVILYKGSID